MEINLATKKNVTPIITEEREELGVIYQSKFYDYNESNFLIKTLEHSNWNINMLITIESISNTFIRSSSINSTYILINVSEVKNISLTISSNNFDTVSLQPMTGLFLTNIDLSEKIICESYTHMAIIELKQSYFEQGMFPLSLNKDLQDNFAYNNRKLFKFTHKLKETIQKTFQSSKSGLCQFMYINAKIFEILSIVTARMSIDTTLFKTHPYQKQIEKVKETIDNTLDTQHSINDLAKVAGLNTSYLKKYFKEVFQETIFEYSSRKRMNLAKKLLRSSQLPIASIGEKIGYQQAAHFSYAFKKNTKCTPNQYRKKEKIS